MNDGVLYEFDLTFHHEGIQAEYVFELSAF